MAALTPVVIDFESFWSVSHSLTKMSPIEYVMHPETEIISMAIKFGNKPTTCMFGEETIAASLRHTDWSDKLCIGHNMSGFDSMILAWRFNVHPKMWGCTLAMSKPLHQKDVGGSLKSLVEHYQLGVKDSTALLNTKGRHLKDFTPAEIDAMRRYNIADVDQCHALFNILLKETPKSEMKLIDHTVRMLVEPKFVLDTVLLTRTLLEEQSCKQKMLVDVATMVGAYEAGMDDSEAAEAAAKVLASQQKFSQFLRDVGVEVPMKPSPTNPDKQTPALAKTDEAFIALQSHPDPMVATAALARLGVKSTLLETRIEKFLQAGSFCEGRLPVPLKYYGGHTGRFSGEQYNPQNLPRINPDKPKPTDALRNSLCAPEGHMVVVADLSGIELRANHFLWQVPSSMALFQADPEKADLYKDFAAKLYGKPVGEVSKSERQIGKLCLSKGTLLLCKQVGKVSWKPIEDFTPDYQLWDGENWVWAKGLVCNGWKKTQPLCGISLTPDHLVLSGTTWTPAQCMNEEKIRRALATAAENLSLRDMFLALGAGCLLPSLNAIAGVLNTRLQQALLRGARRAAVTFARLNLVQALESCIGGMQTLWPTMSTENAYSTGFLQRFLAATRLQTSSITTMEAGVSQFVKSGAQTGGPFCGTQSPCPGGTFLRSKWTALMSMMGISQGIYDSYHDRKTCATEEVSLNLSSELRDSKRNSLVYDIVDCGTRNCFTVLSNRGPLIVHNCHLGLGFQAGPATFVRIAKLKGGVDMDLEEAKQIVAAWRAAYKEIVEGWKKCQSAMKYAVTGEEFAIDPWGMCTTVKNGIKTPKGFIRYPELRQIVKDDRTVWVCGQGRNLTYLSGGKVCENLVQHLARHVVTDVQLAVQKLTGHIPALSVHDELVYVVPAIEAEELLTTLQHEMRTPPKWWPELVTWSEGACGDTYGESK